jgi:hypothetical protein
MEINWVDGYTVRTEIQDGTVVIKANREGLMSLARIMIGRALERSGAHIHLDEHDSLEEGSAELIIDHEE